MNTRNRHSLLLRLTTAAVLTSGALILSWIEAMLPFSIGIPGIKLGLCHIVTLFAVYRLSAWEATAISVVRVVLVALLFGNVASLAYSAAGAMLSLMIMLLLRRLFTKPTDSHETTTQARPLFSPLGVSILGGIAHNVAQLGTAALLMQTPMIMTYLPVLLVAGTLTGALIGLIAAAVLKRVKY